MGAPHAPLVKPGQVYALTIRPFPTANVFKKGHRIRLDISSSNFPRFDVNPNTGEPLGRERRLTVVDNTVLPQRGARLVRGAAHRAGARNRAGPSVRQPARPTTLWRWRTPPHLLLSHAGARTC